jgi:lipopolysaccharide export system permease protein
LLLRRKGRIFRRPKIFGATATLRLANSIDFYIARKVLVPLLSTLVLAAMLLLLEKMLRLFDFVVSAGGPISVVWRMLANLLPEYAGLAIPLGLVMGILLAFRNMALSSELDAMRAVGLGYGRLLRVPLIYTAILMGTNLGIVGYVQPHAEYAYQQLEFELRSGALGASIQVGEFTRLGDDLTLRVEDSENGGRMLSGVFLRVDNQRGLRITATADSGQFLKTDDPDVILLRLTNGRLVHEEADFNVPRVLSFAAHDLPVDLPAIEDFRGRGIGEEELTFGELLDANRSAATPSDYRAKTRANFHFRLAEVLIMLFLPFMAVALAVPPKRSTSGLGMFVAIVFVVAVHKLFQYGEETAAIGLFSPLVSIWIPFTFAAALILWMYYTLAKVPGGQPIGGLERIFAKIAKAIGRLVGTERRKRKRMLAAAE